jgi:hypothetical protein
MTDDPPAEMFESVWRLNNEAWAWVQRHRWAYGDGTPYTPKREDTYMEYRDALVADEGWAYRASRPPAY